MSTINLLPEDYIERRLRRRANTLCLVLFAVVMIGVVAAGMVSAQSARRTEEVDRRVRKEYEDAARLIQQMQQLDSERLTLNSKALATAPLIERIPRSTLLAIVTKSLPQYASLTDFSLETQRQQPASQWDGRDAAEGKKGSKFAQVSAERMAKSQSLVVTLKITGLANTDVEVARFFANMARNPLMKSVDLVYTQEKKLQKDQSPIREFQVRAELRQDTDAIEIVGEKAPADRAAQVLPAQAALGEGQ